MKTFDKKDVFSWSNAEEAKEKKMIELISYCIVGGCIV